jgi:predicted methyltransferase
MNRRAKLYLLVLPLLAIQAGCVELDPLASEDMAIGAGDSATISAADSVFPRSARAIESAVNHPSRLASDREQDDQRRAETVLAFFRIEPGMTVLDMYSGGGYYTELLSYLVGVSGRVVAHNNQPYLDFARDELERRYANNRLSNVTQLIAENNELELEPESFDAVIMIKAYHDLYYVDEAAGWAKVDVPKFLDEIYAALKPGGVLGIVDHNATPGSPSSTGATLHRIDPALIKRDVTAAGFTYAGETSVLRNPDDDLTKEVFADSVRDKTDRSVMRFWKP